MCIGMWRLFCDLDARIVAINPLAITSDQRILALDGKITLDSNARFRHDELADYQDNESGEYGELEARKYGLAYLKMDGNIGMIANGAGLTMATLDMIQEKGGKPANFLDLGSSAEAGKIDAAFDILVNDVNISIILINVYGGMTRCVDVAEGILQAVAKYGERIPIIVNFEGVTAEEAYKILEKTAVIPIHQMTEAVEKAIALAGGSQ